jgi:two-component system sensor histidine kinase CpxA
VRLTRPFYRVADARERETGGAGLALPITERTIRSHAGTVRAANAPNGGLSVQIELPGAGPEFPALARFGGHAATGLS